MVKRNANLDFVRAIAILMVLVFHAPSDLVVFFPPLSCHGFLGVNLFFVLSGMLIGTIYFAESSKPGFRVTTFWLRRWLRTVPPYVAIVGIWAAAHVVRGESGFPPWPYLVFLQNYFSDPYLGEMPFTWSLCVEEHFYLLLPFIGLLARSKRISPALIACAAFPTLARWIGHAPARATHLHFDGLLYGVFLAHARHWDPEGYAHLFRSRFPLWMTAAVLLLAAYFSPWWLEHSLANLSFAIVTGAASCAPAWRVASSRIVHTIAVASYSAYLIHGYAYLACDKIAAAYPLPIRAVVVVLGTVVATGVFYALFEKPSFWLRERLCPAASTGQPRRRH
jgi:peptidoglycan/LPS O-acetylase OafA/YrhL